MVLVLMILDEGNRIRHTSRKQLKNHMIEQIVHNN